MDVAQQEYLTLFFFQILHVTYQMLPEKHLIREDPSETAQMLNVSRIYLTSNAAVMGVSIINVY